MRIIERIDQVGGTDVEIVPLQNASAAEIVRVVNSLYQGANAAEGASRCKVVADERSNSVLIGGEQSQRLRIRALIAHLDTPLEAGGDTRCATCTTPMPRRSPPKLKEQITGIAQAAAGPAGAGGAAGGGAATAQADRTNAMVWADPANNALVITAPPKIMRAVMDIIDKLDIRRAAGAGRGDHRRSRRRQGRRARRQLGRLLQRATTCRPARFVEPGGRHQHRRSCRRRRRTRPTPPRRCCSGTTLGIGRIAGDRA